ncbi:acyltransferase family protein [Peribacillus frigoritolerans]|uniref:acyltransferase family protein n=1 Tax=Peribacillus frigoritolerans TaxID=450367 RepID=UPI003D069E76
MKKEFVKEIFLIRSVACLAIVFLHSIDSSNHKFGETSISIGMEMALLFGTPTFVFISEFILGRSYSENIPSGFLKKRIKNLLIPYVSMGIIYAFVEMDYNEISTYLVAIEIFKNLFLLHYTGYFVVIIFQFYILHVLFHKFLNRWNPKKILLISLIINVGYLAFFNYVPPFSFIPMSELIWDYASWKPFFAWLFYFTFGYYAGKNFEQFKFLITKNNKIWSVGVLLSLFIVITLQFLNLPETVNSKRADIVIYTAFIIPLIFYVGMKMKSIPNFFYFISNYSFSIYLLHKIFIIYFERISFFDNRSLYITFVFFVSLVLSIFVSFILNKFNFGKYIVGNVTSYQNKVSNRKRKAS